MTIEEYKAAYPSAKKYNVIKPGQSCAVGFWVSSFVVTGGLPLTGAFPASGSAVCDKSTAGALVFDDPSPGTHLALIQSEIRNTSACGTTLFDRLVHTQAYSATSAETSVDTTALPSRAADGIGVEIWLESIAVTTANANATVRVEYTNSDNVSGRLTDAMPVVVATTINKAFNLPLQFGDRGVKTVEKLVVSSTWTTGTFSVVLTRRIASFDSEVTNLAVTSGMIILHAPTIPDDACLYLMRRSGSTTTAATTLTLTLAEIAD